MLECLPNLSELSSDEKDAWIVRLFDELGTLRGAVKDLQDRVTSLEAENKKLRAENQELRGKLAKNSKNSSKPPSSDGLKKPKPKSLRKSSGKKPGGQQGHSSARLEMVDQPDHTIVHSVDECQQCGHSLDAIDAVDCRRRQVIDIPPMKLEVTEHQAETKCSPLRLSERSQVSRVRENVGAIWCAHQSLAGLFEPISTAALRQNVSVGRRFVFTHDQPGDALQLESGLLSKSGIDRKTDFPGNSCQRSGSL